MQVIGLCAWNGAFLRMWGVLAAAKSLEKQNFHEWSYSYY